MRGETLCYNTGTQGNPQKNKIPSSQGAQYDQGTQDKGAKPKTYWNKNKTGQQGHNQGGFAGPNQDDTQGTYTNIQGGSKGPTTQNRVVLSQTQIMEQVRVLQREIRTRGQLKEVQITKPQVPKVKLREVPRLTIKVKVVRGRAKVRVKTQATSKYQPPQEAMQDQLKVMRVKGQAKVGHKEGTKVLPRVVHQEVIQVITRVVLQKAMKVKTRVVLQEVIQVITRMMFTKAKTRAAKGDKVRE